MTAQRDAVVVGAGHNGLVAANLLCDAGWHVVVLEQQDRPGGAIRSDESLHPGFVTDWFSAFYPLAIASPVLRSLELDRWGLRWSHAPAVLAHLFPDDRCAVLSRDRARTAESVDAFASGDGAAWLALVDEFERIRAPLLGALFAPFPPVRSGLGLVKALGTADLLRFARFAVQSVRRFGDERFAGEGAPLLLAGNALHTDLGPEVPGSALYGWLLCMLGQTAGYPVPVGGSGALVDALVARLRAGRGTLRTDVEVRGIDVRDGTVSGVVLGDGERIEASAVLADVDAPYLYRTLVGDKHLPARLLDDLGHFQWDTPTMKVNWALSEPIPWTAAGARGAGTVHLSAAMDDLTRYSADLATKRVPEHPFVLLGQMTSADPSRSPAGTESAWAYTHLPEGRDYDAETIEAHAERVQALIERHAPGFGATVLARRVQSPGDLHDADANLVAGAVGGGTSNVYQQLVFRPVPGLARAETPIDGLYLAGASAHPGGGVHGGPGANAARAAQRRAGRGGAAYRRALDALFRRIYR
ncbi:MAG TPA: NAD(P)/FAD-dependent oxidoreductase [Jatrophihabitantaceae bacterium]